MNENLPTPLIDWPYWGKPFEKTPRGYLCRRNTSGAMFRVFFAVFVFLAPLTLIALPIVHNLLSEPIGIGRVLVIVLAIPTLIALLAASLVSVLLVRPLRASVREARDGLDPWRKHWLESERSSLALQQQIRDVGYRLEDAFSKAPGLPATSYRLYNHLDMPMPESGIPLDRQEALERAPHMMQYVLSAVLCNLTRIGGPMVVGRIGDAGVLAIFKPFDAYQVWAKVEFQRSGDALVPRLFTGVQSWSHRYQDSTGNRYRGDMVNIKQEHFFENFHILVLLLPIFGQIVALVGLYTLIHQYFVVDRVARFRSELWPWCGDSSDPVIMSGYKQKIAGSDKWIYATERTQGTLDSLKRQILEAVTMSVGRRI